jgi:predicted GH43/DUF377 family glycosyl hydrolase
MRQNSELNGVSCFLAAPVLEMFYGFRIHDPLGGVYGISHDFAKMLAHEARFWGNYIAGCGIDFWIVTRALSWDLNICEINIAGNASSFRPAAGNKIFADTALALLEAVKRDHPNMIKERLVIKIADVLVKSADSPPIYSEDYSVGNLIGNFRNGCSKYKSLAAKCRRKEDLEAAARWKRKEPTFTDELWTELLLDLLKIYAFDKEEKPEEIVELLTAVYDGKIGSYALDMKKLRQRLSGMAEELKSEIMFKKMKAARSHITGLMRKEREEYAAAWRQCYEQARAPLIPLSYMEYIPGKPIIMPKIIKGKDGVTVQTDNIFRELRKRYEERFNHFIYDGLGVGKNVSNRRQLAQAEQFMADLEKVLEDWLPGDLHTYEGMGLFTENIFKYFAPPPVYTVSPDIIREILIRMPPINLMIPFGFYKPEQLLETPGARNALAYADLTEDTAYTERVILWLADTIKPGGLDRLTLEPLILPGDMQMRAFPYGKISLLNYLAARILISPLKNYKGGKYLRLRCFTDILRRIAAAENYSELFLLNANERKNVGLKIRYVLQNIDRGDDFSASNIFENYHHRSLVNKIKMAAERLKGENKTGLAGLLNLAAEGYGLGQLMENGTFLTCTAWSWASYSFKRGLKSPPPLTTSVENRWFNHELLEILYQQLGYDKEEIKAIVFRLLQEGRGYHSLLDTLLPARPKDVAVIVQETTNEPSKYLRRYPGNPLLEPIEASSWESKYVLNPGALRIKDKVYLFYRAVGGDNVSHIGLAVTDGYKVLERLEQPVFSPAIPEENRGCEDPRLIIAEDKIFMLYTAYDGNIAQIAAASISVAEFTGGHYRNWRREGLVFTNIWDKDAVLFPEKINGLYVLYHRIEPSIWVTYAKELKFPLKEKHTIIMGPRPGRMWDSLKIGAGAQPLKTKYGWLLIYHGVDHNYVYRLGVILVDLSNPERVIFRSPNPILEPVEDFEIGMSGAWVPNVVFTCGAVPGTDKEILTDDDEILVYYGAADTSIGLAKATLAELIPEKFRSAY